MITGIVKFFDSKKGFGFIIRDDTTKDIFFHQKNVWAKRELKQYDKVKFEIGNAKKGQVAVDVDLQ